MVALLLLLYGTNPYLHSVAALDFHPIALAVPIFLWLLYFLDRERYGAALVLAGLSLLVEESLPPGLAGIGLYLALFQPRYRWTGLLMVTVGSVWFLVEVAIFLPHFSQHSLIHWDRYENLGPDFRHALYNLAVDPIFLVKEAFISHYKYYYLLALLFSVGFLPVLAWRQATLILLPAMMMLLSGNGGHYKFGFHYSAAVLPFLFYSSAHGLACLQKESLRMPNWVRSPRLLSSAVLALLILNVYQIRGYRLSHVDSHHVEAIRAVINFLPPDASVRAEGNVVAMLSSRHRIAPVDDLVQENFGWWYPDYFVLDYKHVGANPQHLAARRALLDYLVEADRYHIIVQIDDVVLLRQIRKSDGHCGSAC